MKVVVTQNDWGEADFFFFTSVYTVLSKEV